MTESPSERRIDRKADVGISPSPAKRRVKGIKFVNQSSTVRQKQLLKVQNERVEARLAQHMQRFERLINKAGLS